MEAIRLETGEGGRMLIAEGRLGIQDAQLLKELLMEALESGDELLLDLTRAESVDLACVQVFCSAGISFRNAQKALRMAGDLPEGVVRSLRDMAVEAFVDTGGHGRRS